MTVPDNKVLDEVKKAQAAIIKAGFPYMKFELEAHMWRSGNFTDTAYCQRFLDEFVGEELRKKIIFERFYNDGSVDSELTITFKTEDAHHVTKWMDGFTAMAKAMNGHLDTANAGLHIAVLTESVYPCNKGKLDIDKVQNFAREVSKLLPALLFVSSHNYRTRGLGYRKPQISNDKYSAIAIHKGVFEYRLFDTCYDKPDAIYDKIGIIAQTLKFYSKRKNAAKLDHNIPVRNGGVYAQMFQSPAILEALESSLKYVKPSYKTITQLKKERGLIIDAAKLRRNQLKEAAQDDLRLASALAQWEKRAKLELRSFQVEIKDMKGWVSFTQDHEKAMAYLMENEFIPRKPTKDMVARRRVGSYQESGGAIRANPGIVRV